MHIHPIDVYNRAKAAIPATPAKPPATRWLAGEPDLLGLAAAAVDEPPAALADAAMLEVMVEPAELVVVTTLPAALPLAAPDVELVVKVEPAVWVGVSIPTPRAPAPVAVALPLMVEVKVLPAESVPVVMTTVAAPVAALEVIDGLRVEVKVLPAESVPVVTTTVVALVEALELESPLMVEVKVLPAESVPVVMISVAWPPCAVDVAVDTATLLDEPEAVDVTVATLPDAEPEDAVAAPEAEPLRAAASRVSPTRRVSRAIQSTHLDRTGCRT